MSKMADKAIAESNVASQSEKNEDNDDTCAGTANATDDLANSQLPYSWSLTRKWSVMIIISLLELLEYVLEPCQ